MSLRKNPVAYLALFIALGGTSYAAVRIPDGSVGTAQLRAGAVTGAKVRRGSLTAATLAAGTLPPAPQLQTTVVTPATPVSSCGSSGCLPEPAGTSSTQIAHCPDGARAVGGGSGIPPALAGVVSVTASVPTVADDGWAVTFTLTQAAPLQAEPTLVTAVCPTI